GASPAAWPMWRWRWAGTSEPRVGRSAPELRRQRPVDGRGHELRHVAAEPGDLLDELRGDRLAAGVGHQDTVSTLSSIARFIPTIWNSYSKSATARRPRRM